MSVEPICYVCGKQELCIDGLCGDCTMKEFSNPGAAHAATFGAIASMFGGTPPEVDNTPRCPQCGELMEQVETFHVDGHGEMVWVCTECGVEE